MKIGWKHMKFWNCHFWANSADRPWIRSNHMGKWIKSEDDRLNSPKRGIWKFSWFVECRIGRKKYEKLKVPLLSELSRSSRDSFESARKVDQIQGRLAWFAQKWRLKIFVIFRMSNQSNKCENLSQPLLSELSRSSLDSFESAGKVDQIQGRLA